MKGERTIDDKPFRYGGIERDYDRTSEEWAEWIPEMRRCYICGGKMQIDEPKTQMKTQNSNLTFEKDECAKEYEELGLKELKELIEADRKTENSSEKPNNCDTCRNKGFEGCEQPCLGCDCCGLYEPKDEPQTMLNDGTLVINVEDATKVSRVLVGDDKNRGDLYYPDDEDEPQTDCAWR